MIGMPKVEHDGSSSVVAETPAHDAVSARDDNAVAVVRITSRLNVGGIARHVTWLTSGLAGSGYRSVLLAGVVPQGEEDMTSFARDHGVDPVGIPEMSRELSVKDVVTVWKMYRLFVALRPQVVHTHAAKAGAVGRLAGLMYRWFTLGTLVGRPRRCRFVHTFHGHIFHSYYGRLKTRFFLTVEQVLARLATDRIVVISRQQFHEIHHEFGVGRLPQFRIIPLGLDLNTYADWPTRREALRDELGVGDDLLVGIVGRLTEIKNHSLFLQVAALQKKTAVSLGRRVRFLIIGNGHLRTTLEQQAQELGLQEDVLFLGNRNDPETFYPALDVLALTSLNEGTPLTIIEAMANARAVIATNVGGVVDLLGKEESRNPDDGYAVCERGILVRPRDAEAFQRGLTHLLLDADLRADLGEQGLQFVQQSYAKERLLKDMTHCYDELLGTSPREGGALCPANSAQHRKDSVPCES